MNEQQKRALAIGLPATASFEEIETAEREISSLQTRAQFVPTSLNDEARTVDVVFATETPVRVFSWEDGSVNEILSMVSENVRLKRINSGAPVLDNHDRSGGAASQLGTVENARIENGQAVATLRFSKRESVNDIWRDIKDGIVRGISVGYRVYKYEITKAEGQLPTYRAVDWEPYEISLAPVQADFNSQIRNNELTKIKIENQKLKQMNELEKRAFAVGLPGTATLQEIEKAEADAKERKAAELSEAAKLAAQKEQTRALEINSAVRAAGLDMSFAETLIKENKTIDQAREAVINKIAETRNTNVSNVQNVTIVKDPVKDEKMREAMSNAIEHRANPTVKLTEEGRNFAGLPLLELARFTNEHNGISTRGMSAREVALTAFGLNIRTGYMSSSDFPNVLGNTINRVLRREYDTVGATFQPWTSRGSFTNFKPRTVVQLGETTKMEVVKEGAEYKRGTFGEAKESYSPDKYGKIIPLTWEAIINDDLGAFNRIPRSIATQAKLLQNETVYGILSANAAMNDSVALFHSTHKNLAASGAAISVATLQAGRTAMRTQTGVDGKTVLNLVPKFLVVGPANELTAYQYTSSNYVSTKNSDINPVYNTQLTVIVDPRITGTEWYLVADPSQIDTIEYSFLDGDGELYTEQKVGFDIDGMEIKARMVFAAKAIDWRGLYKNAGA